MKKILVMVLLIAIVISGCATKPETETGVDEGKAEIDETEVVFFGFDLRLSAKEQAEIYAPFMLYLSEKTGKRFKTKHDFKVHFTPDYETTQDNLGKGVTQFAAVGGVSYVQAHEDYDTNILVRGLNKQNKAEYQSIIFTSPDSDINSVEDIKGKSFAFGSTDSTQGHLIPRKMLEDAGVLLDDLENYEYTGSHKNAVEAVIAGVFDAGGAQDTLVRTMAEEGRIKIVKESGWYPSSGIAVNKDVDPELIEAVKQALLEFDPNGEHKEMLTNWDKTEMPNGFTEASNEDYSTLKEYMVKYGFME